MRDDLGTGTLDDTDIIIMMMDGEEAGLRALLQSHGGRVTRFLLSRFQKDIADSALWEAAQKIWSNAHQYDESRGALGPWFLRIAHNCALDIVGAMPVAQRIEGEFDAPDDGASDDEDGRHNKEQEKRAAAMRKIVQALSPAQRRIVEADLAAGGESVNAAELARELGLASAGSVRVQRKKARDRIRTEMIHQGLFTEEDCE